MTKVIVGERALRDLLREVLWNKEFSGWSSNADGPAEVNSGVDPSAAETDPVNPSFVPQNKVEFGVAVRQMVRNLPDEEMPDLYDVVKAAVVDNKEKEDEKSMTNHAAQGGTKQVEAAFRKMIRDTLVEINPLLAEAEGAKFRGPSPFSTPYKRRLKKGEKPGPVVIDDENPLPAVKKIPAGVHGGEYMRRVEKNASDLRRGMGKAVDAYENPKPDPEDPVEEPAPQGGRGRAYKSTALGGMSGVDYDEEAGERKPASFEEIATELGFSVAGAKQAVDKALLKAQWVAKLVDYDNPHMSDDLDIIVLSAMSDYIKKLSKAAVPSDKLSDPDNDDEPLTSADIQLMKDHPDIVEDMPGFREFLHTQIKKAMRPGQKLYNPLSDDNSDVEPETTPESGEEAPAAAAPPPAAPKAGKSSYKIYPGGKKYGGAPAVTRVKGKVYAAGTDTKFKPGEQGEASLDGDKLKVKKPGSDHTQTWEPVEESRRPVLYLRDPRRS